MICQATKTEPATIELPSQSPDGPFLLCAGAANRLHLLSLRPSEWFNLAAIHGPFEYYLHDDFYTEDGDACQPKQAVSDAKRFPCPTLGESSGDLNQLLDFALTRWQLTSPIIDALRRHSPALEPAIRQRFSHTRNRWFHERLVEIAGEVLGCCAERWFHEVLLGAEPLQQLSFLHSGYMCLPHDDGLRTAKEALAQIPKSGLAGWVLVLAHFRDPSTLDWIEKSIQGPITHQWGDAAAASLLDWDRTLKWLRAGRPLSLVALDGLVACSGPHPSQSFLIQKLKPRLQSGVPNSIIEAELGDYADRDRSPRVTKAVRYIIANLHSITGADAERV